MFQKAQLEHTCLVGIFLLLSHTEKSHLTVARCLFIKGCFVFCRVLYGNKIKDLPAGIFHGLSSLQLLWVSDESWIRSTRSPCFSFLLGSVYFSLHLTYVGHCPSYCSAHVFSRLIATILSRFRAVTIDGVWIHSFVHQPFVGSWPLLQFRNLFYTIGRSPWTSDQPVPRPLPAHRTTQTQNKRTHRHPCFQWDSNSRSQRSSERRQFMPYTARPLWSAGVWISEWIYWFLIHTSRSYT
jgi:hypothetical protein